MAVVDWLKYCNNLLILVNLAGVVGVKEREFHKEILQAS